MSKLKIKKKQIMELDRDSVAMVAGAAGSSNSYITCKKTDRCPKTMKTSVTCPTTTGGCKTSSNNCKPIADVPDV
jgi:hypothetical protein